MQITPQQALTVVKKVPLSDAIERVTAHTRTGAHWLYAGCLLLTAFDAAAATSYVVNTAGDPGPAGTLSFRQALNAATASNSIVTFDNSLRDSTITLSQGVIVVGSAYDLYIEGPGSKHLTIAGNGLSPVLDFFSNPGKFETLNLSGLTVTNGKEQSGSGIFGGGCLLAKYSTLGLSDVVVTGCVADDYGGGVLVKGGNLTMHNSTITGNSSKRGGGGIHAFDPGPNNVYIYDSTVSNNTTYGYGAGIFATATNHFRVTRSLISGNTVLSPPGTGVGGGGIALKTISQQALIVNSTIANNYTNASGGGIGLFDAGSAQVTQVNFSTISGNYSGFGYGGNAIHSLGSFSIASSIIANNFNRSSNVDIDGTASVDHSLILNIGSANVSGSNNIFGSDPSLGPLTFNGGPTLTMLPKPGSPVIDAGGDPGTISKDQRGLPRHVGASTDMGAVERQPIEDEIFRDGFDST
jgi:hypothetical protein